MRNFRPVWNSRRPEFSSVCGQIALSVNMSKVNWNSRRPGFQFGFSNRFEDSSQREIFMWTRVSQTEANWIRKIKTAFWDGIVLVSIVVLMLLLIELNSSRFEIVMWMQRKLAHLKLTQDGVSQNGLKFLVWRSSQS